MKFAFRWYDGFLLLLLIYLFVFQIEAIWPFTIDDMYITLRYAKQWFLGNGLVWNLNTPPVEGYSNFSFLILGVVALYFHLEPVLVLKAAGIVGLFFSCFFLFLVTRFWFERRLSLIPCIGLLLYRGEIIWASSGLETTVYQALIIGSIYFIFLGLGYRFFPQNRDVANKKALVFAALLMALAAMTRPEAPVLMCLFFVLMCWDKPKNHLENIKNYWHGMILFLVTFFLMYLPYFLWRWHYYGFLFPNPIYCKGFATDSFLIVRNYGQLIWPLTPLIILALIRCSDKRLYFLCLPSVLYLLMLINADSIVAFENRLFLPAFPLLLSLTLIGYGNLISFYTQQRDQVFMLSVWGFSFLIAFFFIPVMSLSAYHYFSQTPLAGEQLRHSVLNWLNTHTHEGDRVVLGDAGMIPYYSNLHFIDSYCLNNKQMAHDVIKERYQQFCHRILKDKPEIIILTSLMEHGTTHYTPADSCLKDLLIAQNNYKLNETFLSKNSDSFYRYEVFAIF